MLAPEAHTGMWIQELPSSWLMDLTLLEQTRPAYLIRAASLFFCTHCVTPFLSSSSTCLPTHSSSLLLRLCKKEHSSHVPSSNYLVMGSEKSPQDKDTAKCLDLTWTVWAFLLFINQQLAPGRQLRSVDPGHFPLLFICFLWGHYPSTAGNIKQLKYPSTEDWLKMHVIVNGPQCYVYMVLCYLCAKRE